MVEQFFPFQFKINEPFFKSSLDPLRLFSLSSRARARALHCSLAGEKAIKRKSNQAKKMDYESVGRPLFPKKRMSLVSKIAVGVVSIALLTAFISIAAAYLAQERGVKVILIISYVHVHFIFILFHSAARTRSTQHANRVFFFSVMVWALLR
jgi:hypothetical protein